jgi:Na+-translocating ferredoxin:NAD+ oxidoreductase RNF subunit RnfB
MFLVITVVILALVGLAWGLAIFFANRVLPDESDEMRRTAEIAEVLPGMNCGACGQPGCFAYAQALVADPETIKDTPCMTALKDPVTVENLENLLGFKLETDAMDLKAVVHCVGKSEHIVDYKGIDSCKTAAQLFGGTKKCPFGCIGLGDCLRVCPYDAYTIDPERNVAVVDWDKCVGCGLCVAECPHGLIELVSSSTAQFLGCSYTTLLPIPGRERCEQACIKCRKCVRADEQGRVTWDDARILPVIPAESVPDSVEACPAKVIIETK